MLHSDKPERYNLAEQLLVDDKVGLVRSIRTLPPHPGDPLVFVSSAQMSDYTYHNSAGRVRGGSGYALDEDQARMAALGEAVERYCCVENDPEALIVGSYADLARRFHILHPDFSFR